jgi:transcriptional regulator with XRE-family HTH domain
MTETTEMPGATGRKLRRARELSDLRPGTAARALGIRRARLRDWESGRSVPDADELARAVQLYSADLNHIWPDREPLISPEEPGVLIVGDDRIEAYSDTGSTTGPGQVATRPAVDNRVVLSRYIAAVRRQRGVGPDDPVELRAQDVSALATVLDLDDMLLEVQLMDLLDLTPAGARWTARAMVVGALMAVGAGVLVGASWFGAAPSTAAAAESPAATTPFAPEASDPTPEPRSGVQFAPGPIDADAPIDAEVVDPDSDSGHGPGLGETTSPFSTEPNQVRVELAPAVFAIAPSTEWTMVSIDPAAPVPDQLPPA